MNRLRSHYERHAGVYAVAQVAGAVALIEAVNKQTVSTGYDRILSGEYGKTTALAVLGASSVIFAHTINAFDAIGRPEWDMFGRVVNCVFGDK